MSIEQFADVIPIESGPTRNPRDFRYTDRDVVEQPELMQMAMDYVARYGGQFEPIVSAQHELRTHGNLCARSARIALNTMLSDPRVRLTLRNPVEPHTGRPMTALEEASDLAGRVPVPTRRDYVLAWRAQPRRIQIEMYATVKMPFVAGRTGRLLHLPMSAETHWSRMEGEIGSGSPYTFFVKVYCNKTFEQPYIFAIQPSKGINQSGKAFFYHICSSCITNKEDA